MHWKVHIEGGIPRKNFEKQTISNKQKVMHNDEWYGAEVKAIWQQIATDECLDYFLVKTNKLALSVNQGHLVQIRKLLSAIVAKYSLSRCFEMIHSVCTASRDYIKNGNYTDEIRKQDILFSDFQNGAKHISKYTVGPCIEERLNETRRSVALRVLFEEILNFDYAEDWFDACLVDMNFFE